MEQNKALLNLIASKEIQQDRIPHELSGKETVLDGFCNQLSL